MEPISEHFVFFTPDIHAGTKIDLVSSLLYLNQSIILSSLSGGLKSYYKPPVAVTTSFQANDTRPQVVVPKKRVLGKEENENRILIGTLCWVKMAVDFLEDFINPGGQKSLVIFEGHDF